MTPKSELKMARERLRAWYKAFPYCQVAISNHGVRWASRAFESYIPQEILRPYKELIQAPAGWRWHEEIMVKCKSPFRVIHGVGYSGMNGHRNAAIDAGMSTAIGHLHSFAGVNYVHNGHKQFWAMNTGCLIDQGAMAFHYAKNSRFKATLSVGVVVDDGKSAHVVSM